MTELPTRRRVLSVLGTLGVGGTAGCLRLQGGESGATTPSSATTTGSSPTPPSEGTETPTPDGSLGDAERLTLSERWAADFGVDYVLTDGGHYYFNDFNRVGEAMPGDGVLWSREVGYEGSESNLGADAIAVGDGAVVSGFFSEPASVERPGAHFVAHEGVTGEERWTFTLPAGEDTDYTNLPRGAAVGGGVAVVSVSAPGSKGAVYGLDIESGEERWRTESFDGINGLDADGDVVYVDSFRGVTVLDAETGSVTDRHESWPSAPIRVHAGSLFGNDRTAVRAVPVADGGVEWTAPDVGQVVVLRVDNSLVVAGTESGGVHAFERATGERRWETTIDGTVWQVELTGGHVWVADRETGLTAYDRDDGRTVHRSTQSIERGDIGVTSGTILLGNETARAYDIEAA